LRGALGHSLGSLSHRRRIIARVTPAVETFEARFASWLSAAGAAAFGFGRAALRAALEAADVAGAAVAVPEFICGQVPEAVRLAGARPVGYPVGRDLSIAPEDFARVLEQRCRAAVVPHYFGRVLPNIFSLAALSRARGVVLIEDAALALGASLSGALAGSFGDLAVFSFTKSGWCYGGGIAAARSGELLERLHGIRRRFAAARLPALRYGLLRRFDYASNRPGWANRAALAGRLTQGLLGPRHENFYDAGRFDTRLAAFAARRAAKMLDQLSREHTRRQEILAALEARLPTNRLFRPAADPGDAATFLLLRAPSGDAPRWAETAAARGVTLRLAWRAYQPAWTTESEAVAWLARHLVILEIHPGWSAGEVASIGAVLVA
jgi:dTDP-4-amino-4,6-dideoxygalactose transaminase